MTLNEILYYLDLCLLFLNKEKVWKQRADESSFEEFWPPLYRAQNILEDCKKNVGGDWDTKQFRESVKSIADGVWGRIHNRGDIINSKRFIAPTNELSLFLSKFGIKRKRVYVWEFANISGKVAEEI